MSSLSNALPSKRHILIDARNLSGGRNGITRYVEQLMQAWPAAAGFRTTLISNKPIISNAAIPGGVEIFVDTHPLAKLPGTIWLQLRAKSIARQLGATDFLGPQHVIPLSLARQLNTGVVVHDLVFDRYPETMAFSNRVLSRQFAPKSIRASHHIFCVSETTLSDLETYLKKKLPNAKVSHPGLTEQSINLTNGSVQNRRNDIVRLLVVGSMEPRKNVAKFLKIFIELTKLLPDVHLDMVSGDGWGQVLEPTLRERVMTHPSIKIHQGISDAALDALYREVDFLVFPSIYEGFGLPILEATGKCAVIANDIPIFRELAKKIDGVELLDFGTQEHVAAKQLAKLIPNINRASARIRPEFLDQFRWETCANTIISGMGLSAAAFN